MISRVRMRSSGDRRKPVRVYEATGKRRDEDPAGKVGEA